MERMLISFIGKGPPAAKGQESTRSGYTLKEYSFVDGSKCKTSLFGWALWQYLCRKGPSPTAWLILGTSGSFWTALIDALDEATFNRCLKWFEDIDAKAKKTAVRQEDLDAVPPALAGGLGVPRLRLALISECATSNSQRHFMSLLTSELPQDCRVILDITHGYRHLPVLAFFLLAGLRWLRNVTIEGVYYGAAEMLAVPVVDLSICTQYADITTALATFELIGSHRALAPFFPEACDDLDKSGFLEEINQFTRARETAEKAGANLTPGQDGDPFLQEISKQLSVTLQWAVKERSVSTASRMLQRARFCFGRRDYMRASFLALEAIILHGVRQKKPDHSPSQYSEKLRAKAQRWLLSNLSGEDKERFRLLRDLRNAIGHGSKGGFPRVKDAVKDEGRMETLLKELLDFAENLCGR
jgi:CRISPR-associated Csx2 family protein